ncbi:leucine-rich repeat-containing protein 20 isoform X1 [Rhea pennata]|uniref:leucine-rich repeat-containing protein 20 isoform X1 n=1 Tax=Rhea pennata TaxID=8795 RepID=UPI002E259F77
MQKKMGEAVARVARKVNDTVENKSDSLDLAECKLMTFPVGIYKAVRSVADGIHRITLANNELKALTSRFMTTFSQLRELDLEGNLLHRLPEEVRSLPHLRAINLSRNRFRRFPEPLAAVSTLETIELEENEIAGRTRSKGAIATRGALCLADVPVELLAAMRSLRRLNLRANPLGAELRALAGPLVPFELLVSPEGPPRA